MLDASIWPEYGPIRCVYIENEGFQLPQFTRVRFVLEDSGMSSSQLWLSPWWGLVFTRSFEKQLPRGRGKKTDTKYEIPWNCHCLPQRNWLQGEGCWGWGHLAITVFQINPRWHQKCLQTPGWSRNESQLHTQHATTEAAGCCNASLFVFEGVKVDGNRLPNGRWITRIG